MPYAKSSPFRTKVANADLSGVPFPHYSAGDDPMGEYGRGTRVLVRGFNGSEAVLVVWEQRARGFVLCTEAGYRGLLQGKEEALVGYPSGDIVGIAPNGA